MIELKNIAKSYISSTGAIFPVLKKINLQVDAGDFLSIMGPSGAGKSTLINIIGFLDNEFSGEYFFKNRNVRELSSDQMAKHRNKEVGFIFQDFKLIDDLSIEQNVGLPLIYAGKLSREIKSEVIEVLEQVGMLNAIDKYPMELSGGEKQRVSIARALIMQPAFILADEPTGALDSENSREVMKLFDLINKEQNLTIIVVTHDINVANKSRRTIHILDGYAKSDEVN